jgi:hypothetical protein
MTRCAGFFLLLVLLAFSWVPSANAAQFLYEAFMDGPTEPSPSLGTGYGTVLYDDVAHTLGLNATFSGLSGTTTNSHIHAPTNVPFAGTASVATTTPTFAGFPSGVTAGAYSNTLDLTLASSWNAPYITANGGTTAGAETALALALSQGKSYWNIHSSLFGGGEIRGFLRLVPEPATCVMAAIGLAGLGCVLGRRRS